MFLYRCFINCGRQVIASSQLSLTSSCTGTTCEDLIYQWGLYVENNQSTVLNTSLVEWRVLKDLDNGSRIHPGFRNLVIKGNIFYFYFRNSTLRDVYAIKISANTFNPACGLGNTVAFSISKYKLIYSDLKT